MNFILCHPFDVDTISTLAPLFKLPITELFVDAPLLTFNELAFTVPVFVVTSGFASGFSSGLVSGLTVFDESTFI